MGNGIIAERVLDKINMIDRIYRSRVERVDRVEKSYAMHSFQDTLKKSWTSCMQILWALYSRLDSCGERMV